MVEGRASARRRRPGARREEGGISSDLEFWSARALAARPAGQRRTPSRRGRQRGSRLPSFSGTPPRRASRGSRQSVLRSRARRVEGPQRVGQAGGRGVPRQAAKAGRGFGGGRGARAVGCVTFGRPPPLAPSPPPAPPKKLTRRRLWRSKLPRPRPMPAKSPAGREGWGEGRRGGGASAPRTPRPLGSLSPRPPWSGRRASRSGAAPGE